MSKARQKSLDVRFLLCCVALLAGTSGCSCSSHIPESGPGEGPVSEIRNVQTGELIQAAPDSAAAPGAEQFGTPTNAQPAAVKAKTTADTLP